jgi:hypothetical protein
LIAGSHYLVFPNSDRAVYLAAPDLGPDPGFPGLREHPDLGVRRPEDRSGYRIFESGPWTDWLKNQSFNAGHFEADSGPLRIIGQTTPGPWSPGRTQRVTVYWQPAGPLARPDDLQLSLQVFDRSGRRVAQQDRLGYPATTWQAGELVLSFFDLAIAKDADSGPGRLETTGARRPGRRTGSDPRDRDRANTGPLAGRSH